MSNIATVVKHHYKVIKIIEDLENKLSESEDMVSVWKARVESDVYGNEAIRGKQKAIDHLHEVCEEQEQELIRCKETVDELRRICKGQEGDIEHLSNDISNREIRISYLQTDVKNLSKALVEKQEKMNSLEAEVQYWKEKAGAVPKEDAPYEVGDIVQSIELEVFGEIIKIIDDNYYSIIVNDLIDGFDEVHLKTSDIDTHWKKV